MSERRRSASRFPARMTTPVVRPRKRPSPLVSLRRVGGGCALSFAVLVQAACAPPPSTAPDAAWKRFVEATRKGDAPRAWALLSARTQAELTARAQRAAQIEGSPPPDDGSRYMLTPQAQSAPALDAVESVFLDPTNAQVRVRVKSGETGIVRAVREDGEWRFDLVDAIRASD